MGRSRRARPAAGAAALALLVLSALALTAASVLPGLSARYFLLLPGDVRPVAPAIELPSERRRESGDLHYAIVYQAEASLPAALLAATRPGVRVVPYEEIVPPGTTSQESSRINQQLMLESQTAAAVVALRQLGLPAEVTGEGVRIAEVVPGRPAAGKLRVGDVVIAQDGRPVPTAVDLIQEIRKRRPGDEVVLTLRRDGQELVVTVGTVPSPSEPERPIVGAMVETEGLRASLPFPVAVDAGNVVGPSAGLMFALGIYDALTPGQLGRGRKVAGTGTVGLNGEVGPVDGAAQKVLGAAAAGAELFLVPRDNLEDARSAAPPTIRVVPVDTFADALVALD